MVRRLIAAGRSAPARRTARSPRIWAQRLGRTLLTARQLSARGGEFTCELCGDRVGVAGRAIAYLRGQIEIGDAG